MTRMRHYYNLWGTEAKLDELLAKFAFGPVRDAIATHAVTDRLLLLEDGLRERGDACER